MTVWIGAAPEWTSITPEAGEGGALLWDEPPSSDKDILTYAILDCNIILGADTISITYPWGGDPSSLTPLITISGISIDPPSGVADDFTNPIVYTVIATDGSIKEYVATATEALSSENDVLTYSILGLPAAIVRGRGVGTIDLVLPYGTDLTDLTPTITVSPLATILPVSGEADDFTSVVRYVTTAQNSDEYQWDANITEAPYYPKEITTFKIVGIDAIIDEDLDIIRLTLPHGTDLTILAPDIIITGVSVVPASGDIVDFTNPVVYEVTAEDASTKQYLAIITEGLTVRDVTSISTESYSPVFAIPYGLFFEFWLSDLTQGDCNVLCKYSPMSPQWYFGLLNNEFIIQFFDIDGNLVIDEHLDPTPYIHRWCRITMWIIPETIMMTEIYNVYVFAAPAGEIIPMSIGDDPQPIPIASGIASNLPDPMTHMEPMLSGHVGRIRNIQLWALPDIGGGIGEPGEGPLM
jgi:hypothetical protein